MARLFTYTVDDDVRDSDRLIGSDVTNGNSRSGATRNFTVGSIRDFSLSRRYLPTREASTSSLILSPTSDSPLEFLTTYRFNSSTTTLTLTVAEQLITGSGSTSFTRYPYGIRFGVLNESVTQDVTVIFPGTARTTVPPMTIIDFEFIDNNSWAVIGGTSSGTADPGDFEPLGTFQLSATDGTIRLNSVNLIPPGTNNQNFSLPNNPQPGERAIILNRSGNINNRISSTSLIEGSADDLIIDDPTISFELIFYSTTNGWYVSNVD